MFRKKYLLQELFFFFFDAVDDTEDASILAAGHVPTTGDKVLIETRDCDWVFRTYMF